MENKSPYNAIYHFNQDVSLFALSETIADRIAEAEAIAITGSRSQIDELTPEITENFFRALRNQIEEIGYFHKIFMEKIKSERPTIDIRSE